MLPFGEYAKRPGSVISAAAMQSLLGVVYAGLGTLTLLPCRPTNEGEVFGCAAFYLPTGWSFALLTVGLIALVGAAGMWKGLPWGWWLSVLVDSATTCGSAYQTIKEFNYLDAGQVLFGVSLASIPVGLLSLPSVREFCLKA